MCRVTSKCSRVCEGGRFIICFGVGPRCVVINMNNE